MYGGQGSPRIYQLAGDVLQRGSAFTDISIHTTDGQTALWIVEKRDAEWVRRKLTPVLSEERIPLD